MSDRCQQLLLVRYATVALTPPTSIVCVYNNSQDSVTLIIHLFVVASSSSALQPSIC